MMAALRQALPLLPCRVFPLKLPGCVHQRAAMITFRTATGSKKHSHVVACATYTRITDTRDIHQDHGHDSGIRDIHRNPKPWARLWAAGFGPLVPANKPWACLPTPCHCRICLPLKHARGPLLFPCPWDVCLLLVHTRGPLLSPALGAYVCL